MILKEINMKGIIIKISDDFVYTIYRFKYLVSVVHKNYNFMEDL